jgi:tRNA modification GTPase
VSALDDTIAAIATPLGEGGLAIIRVSGPQALAVADRVFEPTGRAGIKPSAAPSHTVHFGRILHQGQPVDEVLLTVLRAPRTYTRQDTVEISAHGGLLVARLVLEAVLQAGARLAEPGEFTKRAFLNGRIDLAQAEAVADLIHSRTELALAAARAQLAGNLSRQVNSIRDQLMHVLAHVEAQIDFPEEDIEPETRAQLLNRLETALSAMDQLLQTAREGHILRHGIRTAIIGRPNVGKSSLLNLLLGRDRAIVSAIPGTTRDTIEETANIRGLPVVLIDTAGLRPAGDPIEAEGIRRSRQALAQAELVLLMFDASEPFTHEDQRFAAEAAGRPRIVVCNKIDLPRRLELPPELAAGAVQISCLTHQGIESLKDAIKAAVWTGSPRPEAAPVAINARHQDALRRGREAAQRALDALGQDLPLELVAADLRSATQAVGEIVGQTATADLLDLIFSQFCIGK